MGRTSSAAGCRALPAKDAGSPHKPGQSPALHLVGPRFVVSVNPSISIPRTDCLTLEGKAEIRQPNHGLGSSNEEGVLACWRCFFLGDCLAGGQQTPNGYDHFRKLGGLRL